MRFLKNHWRGILISSLLLIPLAFAAFVAWSASEIASPPRRPLADYHRAYLTDPNSHGLDLRSFAARDGTPVVLCTPTAVPGTRGQKIRSDLTARGISLLQPGKIIGTIVLIHGRRGRKEDYLPIAERLCAVGFRCLLFDLPAHGENQIPTATYGIREAALPVKILLEAAAKFHFDPQPASLFGMSMGGSVAIHSCARPDAPWKSLVIISSFDSFAEILEEKATSRAGQPLGALWFQATDALYQQKTGLSTTAVQPAKLAAHLALPTLIAHGTTDTAVPFAAGQRLYRALPDTTEKRWIEVPKATHDNVLVTDFPIYAEIAAWFLNHTF